MGKRIEERRALGSTGIQVSPFCYGCAGAYGRDVISDQLAVDLFKQAYDHGINFFDTGHSYGTAEERIGLALKTYPSIKRNDIVISTKFGTRFERGRYVHDMSLDLAKFSIELSMKRMGIDYIDVLYVHNPYPQDMGDEKLFLFLEDLKRQGIIKATGANTFSPTAMDRIAKEKLFEVVSLDYNIVKQKNEIFIEKLYANDIGVVAGQAMAEGIFLNDLFKVRSKKDLWYLARTIGREDSRKLFLQGRQYRFLNNIDGMDGSQIALKFVVDNPHVSSTSFATCSFDHLRKNVEALEVVIPQSVLHRIRSASMKQQ